MGYSFEEATASLPVRECGLKCVGRERDTDATVTPRAGVWIEISQVGRELENHATSLPVRECGLKYH